jgi:hypothetical protein
MGNTEARPGIRHRRSVLVFDTCRIVPLAWVELEVGPGKRDIGEKRDP